MKKLISIIPSIILMFSLCACSGSSEQSSTPTIENPDLGRNREELISEACTYIFPAEGEQDINAAIEVLLPLVENGDAEAQYYFAWINDFCLEENNETDKESLYWYERAMEQGYSKAYLGACSNYSVDSQEKAHELGKKAIELGVLEMSDEELGPDGMYSLALLYGNGYGLNADYSEAFKWYKKAAEEGFSKAMNAIGIYYINGSGVEQNYELGLEWLQRAAASGNDHSYYNLGQMYHNGIGVIQDYEKAFEFFLKGAKADDCDCIGFVGGYYIYGYCESIGIDYDEAIAWFSKGAELNHAYCMSWLGSCYANGIGVGHDYEKAMDWYITAYIHGSEEAEVFINELLSKNVGINTYYERYEEFIFSQAK